MYVPNIKAGRYAADSIVKRLIAMDSNSMRDGNHYIASEMVEKEDIRTISTLHRNL